MLGVARTAQLAAWGGTPPLVIRMQGQGDIIPNLYQTPAFSYLISPQSRPQWQLETDATAAIDNSVNDFKGFALATTFRMEWDEQTVAPQDENVIYGFFHQVNIKTTSHPGFNSINMFLQLRDGRLNVTSRFESNTIARVTKDLPGQWQDYNNRWMTVIFASSQDPATFVNYAPSQGTAFFGSWNTRSTLYDTETAEVIQTIDFVAPNTLDFPGLAEWPFFQGSPAPVALNLDGENGITVMGSIDSFLEPAPQPYRLANIWGSIGRSFDPLQYGRELLTVRPAKTINNATAWYNIQFDTAQTPVGGQGPYFIAPGGTGADWMVSNTGRALDLTYGNSASEFAAGHSTTIIPKDRS
jgi:hypothetical protein